MSVDALRAKKQQRARRVPPDSRHPVRDITAAGTAAPPAAVAVDTADEAAWHGAGAVPVDAGVAGLHDAYPPAEPAVAPTVARSGEPAPAAAAARAAAIQAPAAPVLAPAAAAPVAGLPDLMIDWSDPDMYPVKATRASVPLDLAARFKADDHATAQTQRALAAVVDNLQQLPELVLAVRGQSLGGGTGFFFSPTPVKRSAAARGDVFLRLKRGEEIALERIRVWVTEVIQRDNPGRAKVTRSDLIHAALAIVYGD